MFLPKLLVAGTRSGAGKTTLTLALLAALKQRGLKVQACKLGPDFIDPSHHALLTGRPSYNIDTWMLGTSENLEKNLQNQRLHSVLKRIYSTAQREGVHMLVAEGAMGLFDGACGMGGEGSAAHVAATLHMPILLALDVRGMGQSAAAMALGYIRAQDLPFAGLVCTHVASKNHAELLQEAFLSVLQEHEPPVLGYLPEPPLSLPSRHLGLHMGHECALQTEEERSLGAWLEEHMDMDALLARSYNGASSWEKNISSCGSIDSAKPLQGAHIGIAKDAAFCFIYADMADVLQEMGAIISYFSPLHDAALPEHCTSLYFPGGYPELYAAKLSANTDMLKAVRAFAEQNKRIYAECGGYMYLMQHMEYEGIIYDLCALLPLHCAFGKTKAALGYREVCFADALHISGRGHEFHYAHLIQRAENCDAFPPLWQVKDRKGRILDKDIQSGGIVHGSTMASWIHVYPEGAKHLLARIFAPSNT